MSCALVLTPEQQRSFDCSDRKIIIEYGLLCTSIAENFRKKLFKDEYGPDLLKELMHDRTRLDYLALLNSNVGKIGMYPAAASNNFDLLVCKIKSAIAEYREKREAQIARQKRVSKMAECKQEYERKLLSIKERKANDKQYFLCAIDCAYASAAQGRPGLVVFEVQELMVEYCDFAFSSVVSWMETNEYEKYINELEILSWLHSGNGSIKQNPNVQLFGYNKALQRLFMACNPATAELMPQTRILEVDLIKKSLSPEQQDLSSLTALYEHLRSSSRDFFVLKASDAVRGFGNKFFKLPESFAEFKNILQSYYREAERGGLILENPITLIEDVSDLRASTAEPFEVHRLLVSYSEEDGVFKCGNIRTEVLGSPDSHETDKLAQTFYYQHRKHVSHGGKENVVSELSPDGTASFDDFGSHHPELNARVRGLAEHMSSIGFDDVMDSKFQGFLSGATTAGSSESKLTLYGDAERLRYIFNSFSKTDAKASVGPVASAASVAFTESAASAGAPLSPPVF